MPPIDPKQKIIPIATRPDKFCFLMRNMPQFIDKPDTEGDELLEKLVELADFTIF